MRKTIRQERFDDKVCDHLNLGLVKCGIAPVLVEKVLTGCEDK